LTIIILKKENTLDTQKINLVQGSQEWLETRKQYFCASETPQLLGMGYSPRSDLFKSKTIGSRFKGNAATERGHRIETEVEPYIKMQFGNDVQFHDIYTRGRFLASLDAYSPSTDTIIEIKTVGTYFGNPSKAKKAYGMGEIYEPHRLQVMHQMYVKQAKQAIIIVFDTRSNGEWFEFFRSEPIPFSKLEWLEIEKEWAKFDAELQKRNHPSTGKTEAIPPQKINPGVVQGNDLTAHQGASDGVAELKKSADQGNADAQNRLGNRYAQGQGVAQNYREAMKCYRLAADQGYANAQTNLGLMYANGLGISQSDTEAVRWYQLAADQGYANAQTNLGWMYAKGRGVSQSDTEAVRWFQLAADQGYDFAQYYLGEMYRDGRGVSQSDTEAVRWYQLAADQGHARAQCNLGVMYRKGLGVAQNDTEAVRWYKLAAAQGNATAKNNLDLIYANRKEVRQKDTLAKLKKAAAQGNATAQYELGQMHGDGRGVSQNDNEAVRWYRLAAAQGHLKAQLHLGDMYSWGFRGTKDDAEALRWYHLAAKQGDIGAKRSVKYLEKKKSEADFSAFMQNAVMYCFFGIPIFLFLSRFF
jgi:putative phage-type endonuclease